MPTMTANAATPSLPAAAPRPAGQWRTALLGAWDAYRLRRALREMDDRMLQDIGFRRTARAHIVRR